eukprot:TRINITY_DN3505_c0_g1_i1.p1 TRINITY_DN3505_c0_g1~~TRINITY_DN3505_c0_g1_i1.p1  ORF type:complete len:149 (-),score=43.93 TRINITY_DN3505_c0_g1_i1:41-487(-)
MTTQPRVIKLTDDLAFGAQPSEPELKSLAQDGIKSVINMRETHEKGFIAEEQNLVESQGLKYDLLPIRDANDFTAEYTNNIIDKIEAMPKPILVHCNVGLTAAVASLLYVGKAMKVDADQVFAWASDLGYNLAFHAQLYQFIKDYMKQ